MPWLLVPLLLLALLVLLRLQELRWGDLVEAYTVFVRRWL